MLKAAYTAVKAGDPDATVITGGILYNNTAFLEGLYTAGAGSSFDGLGIHPYAKGLMGSIIVPEKGLRDVELTAIPGVPPNLKNPPAGCRFAERCKYCRPECKVLSVLPREVPGDREYRCIVPERELREIYAKEKEAEQHA